MNGNKNFAGKDIFQRMNYLYQISNVLIEKTHDKNVKTKKECLEYISNYYSSLMVNIGKKTQLRIDPSIKRTICKGCQKLLIPGKTARVRFRKKPMKHLRWTCLHCGSFRTYNMKKDYQLWCDNPQALVNGSEKAENHEDKTTNQKVKTSNI